VSAAGQTGKSVSLRALERVFSMAVAIELRNGREAGFERFMGRDSFLVGSVHLRRQLDL
jgi:hypothetical protein